MRLYFRLVLYVFLAWMVHATLVFIYLPYFTSTQGLGFRIIHFLEIGSVMTVAMVMYKRHAQLNIQSMVITAFITLAVIDLAFFRIISPLITSFDTGHFVAAFVAVFVAVFVGSSLSHSKKRS